MPGSAADRPTRLADGYPGAVRMDLHVLVLLSGRERTAAQYAALCEVAELRLTRADPTGACLHVLEVRPA